MKTTGNIEKTSKRPRILIPRYERVMTPDRPGPLPIDLGLPSGTIWASCNVGAYKPEESGDFFAFGETEVKEYYSRNTYELSKGDILRYYNGDILHDDEQDGYAPKAIHIGGTRHDVAFMSSRGLWRIPSKEQFQELMDYCWYDNDRDSWGIVFTSKKNGNSIFLPAAGYRINGNFDGLYNFDDVIDDYDIFPHGFYWTDTVIIERLVGLMFPTHFEFQHEGYPYLSHITDCSPKECFYGFSIRPVLMP